MIGKILAYTLAATLSAAPLLAADSAHPSASFNVSQLTAVPGKTLPPGKYTISVVDHLSDRYIVKVQNASGADRTLFIGIPNRSVSASSHGMIGWKTPTDGATYLRGWNFSSLGTPLEFAYPKADAVAIAKANNSEVPAIDPESDGMVTKASLSKDEMQMITLWLLTPTHVGANSPAGISAARYQQVASVAPVRRPVVSRLPHTASMLPWFWLIGALSLAGAFGMRMLRLATSNR
jgi:hypothetical protein